MRDGAEGKEQIQFNMKHPSSACISANTTIIGRKPTMAATAQAKIVGDDPLNLKLFNLPPRVEASPAPEYEAKLHGVFQSCKLWKAKPNEYEGRYPCGSLVHNGVWYYGTYCLSNKPGDKGGWTLMGPFVGFRTSTDFGKTWTETPCTPRHPLFGENPYRKPIKIGSPHFVDFGRNMEHSPDGFAYLVAHGSMRPDAGNNWIQGDQVYLLRVKPSIQTLNDQSAYEYFAGHDADGKPVWTKTFEEIKPLLEWQDHLGCVTVTYNPGLKKFLLCVSRSIKLKASVLIMESDTLTGPWKVAASMKDFGPDAYFITIPSKFISPDGRTFWLCYSANYITHCTSGGNPPGSHYALCLQEATLLPVKH